LSHQYNPSKSPPNKPEETPPSIIFHPRTRFSPPHKQHKPSLPPPTPHPSPPYIPPRPPHLPTPLNASHLPFRTSSSALAESSAVAQPALPQIPTVQRKHNSYPFPSYLYPYPTGSACKHRRQPKALLLPHQKTPGSHTTRTGSRTGMHSRPGHLLDVLRIA